MSWELVSFTLNGCALAGTGWAAHGAWRARRHARDARATAEAARHMSEEWAERVTQMRHAVVVFGEVEYHARVLANYGRSPN